jgi:hypothetical protein
MSEDQLWQRYIASLSRKRDLARTETGRELARALIPLSETDDVSYRPGMQFLVPRVNVRNNAMWDWDDAAIVAMDVYTIARTTGQGHQVYYHLAYAGTLPPASVEHRRNWGIGFYPQRESKGFKAHADILVPNDLTEGGQHYIRAMSQLPEPDRPYRSALSSLGGGGPPGNPSRDHRERRDDNRSEQDTGKQGKGKKSKRKRGLDKDEERGVERRRTRKEDREIGEDRNFDFGSLIQKGKARIQEEEEEEQMEDPYWSPRAETLRNNTGRNSTQTVRRSRSKEARRERKNREAQVSTGGRRVEFEGERDSSEEGEVREEEVEVRRGQPETRGNRERGRRGGDRPERDKIPEKRTKAGEMDGMGGVRKYQAFTMFTLDGNPVIGQTQADLASRVWYLQGFFRVADEAKVRKLVKNVEIDFTEVAQIVRRALADPDGYGNTVAFDSVDLLCEVADTACFTDISALEEFMVLKGFKVNNYGGINLRWFETKEEFKHELGEEATRQGKAHIITLTGRMEVAMVILWSRAFIGVMDPVKRIKAIGHSKTYDGVIRHMLEEAVCEWAVDVRSSRVPTKTGYTSERPDGTPEYAMDEPEACASLLKKYIEDVVVRLTPMEYGETTRPRRLTPIPPAPHTAFFAKGGPFLSVLNREGSKKNKESTTPGKSVGGEHKKTGKDIDDSPVTPKMVTPEPKGKRDKGPCLWAACKAFGLTNKDGVELQGCTAPDCKYSHLPGADAYSNEIRKEHVQQWAATSVMKAMIGEHVTGFKPEWAQKPGAQGRT